MTSITTRTGKGAPLTISELDANFTNLNTDKVEKTRVVGVASGQLTVTNGGALNSDIQLGLPDTGVTAGTINNSATTITPVTVDAKGRITGTGTAQTITPAFSSITGKPTTLSGYGITDGQTSVTGAASTVTDSNLTASRAVVADASGKIAVSAVTSTELGYLAGTTQNVQTQLSGKQATSEKDQANGYAGLNSSGKLSDAVIPDIAISDFLGAVADQTAMLALTGQKGDWCTRSDVGTVFMIIGNSASVGGWMQLSYPGTPVTSVAGRTGAVTLTKTDVGLSNVDNTSDADKNSATVTLTNKTISGATNTLSNIGNASLTNSSVTVNGNTVALGGSTTLTAANPNALTIGTGLSGTSYTGGSAVTIAIDSTVATLTGSQTLTNKTISGASNTLSNIGNASLTNSSITFGATATSLGGTVSALNGVSIGGTTPAAGNFTTLGATGNVTLGDASADTVTFNAATVTLNNSTTISAATSQSLTLNGGAGTNGLVLSSSNNVGIGTSSPGAKLDISDASGGSPSFRITNSVAGAWMRLVNTGGVNAFIDSNGGFAFRVGSSYTTAATLDASGNVGIGTSSPGTRLELQAPSGASQNVTLRLRAMDSSSSASCVADIAAIGQVANTSSLAFYTRNTSVNEVMRIDSSGNVGIGTSSTASGKVTISGTGSAAALLLTGLSSSNAVGDIYINRSSSTTAVNAAPNIYFSDGTYNRVIQSGTGNLQFFRYSGAWIEDMRLDSSGNLGLGVTPSGWTQKAFQVGTGGAAFSTVNGAEVVENGYYASGTWRYVVNGGASWYSAEQSGAHKWYSAPVGTAGNAILFTQAMTLDASGNLLVGCTSVNYKGSGFTLSSDGSTKWLCGPYASNQNSFYVSAANTYGVYLSSTVVTAWASASDERLKTDLKPIENATQKVLTLRAVTGRFKTDEEGVSRSFLIAQDVQAVLPEAVDSEDQDKLGVRYTETIPLLVAAIKELSAKIETLEAKVNA